MKSHRVLHFGIELEEAERDVALDKWSNEVLRQRELAAKNAAAAAGGGIIDLRKKDASASTTDEAKVEPGLVPHKVDETDVPVAADEVTSESSVATHFPHMPMMMEQHQPAPQQMWFMGSTFPPSLY